MENNDEEITLLMKARNGDNTAMEAVISKYFWLVRSVVRKYFTTNGTEEDLLQEGCLGIFKAVRDYDPEKNDSIVAFMAMCIDSHVKDGLRAATREKHKILSDAVSLTGLDETGASLPAEYIYDPVHNYIEREGLDLFYESIGKLCNDFSVRVLRYYLEGYTYNEIASLTGITSKKVDNILASVKNKIKNNKNLFI